MYAISTSLYAKPNWEVLHYLLALKCHPICNYIWIYRQTLILLISDAFGPSICSPSNNLSSGIETTSTGSCWNGSQVVASDIPAFEGNGITEQGIVVCKESVVFWHHCCIAAIFCVYFTLCRHCTEHMLSIAKKILACIFTVIYFHKPFCHF